MSSIDFQSHLFSHISTSLLQIRIVSTVGFEKTDEVFCRDVHSAASHLPTHFFEVICKRILRFGVALVKLAHPEGKIGFDGIVVFEVDIVC